ncbi:TonB-dependent receptor domain-containing protein [Polymorphobacter sp.]|uniref:TonB-dependent receptor domain-containing protein n=1 Tax=Polymorphobacter sp. TaxID=1909290 RepID=UPI003F713CD2
MVAYLRASALALLASAAASSVAAGAQVPKAQVSGAAAEQSAGEPVVDPAAALVPAGEAPPLTAAGSRAGENAVRQAGDAFGTAVGRETIGIYNRDQVRGFSPVVAGNVRIAGLYFDPVAFPSDRISGSTAIRVGPSAFGSPFPAPTGIVDLGLRVPGQQAAASALVSADSWGGNAVEVDAAVPLGSRLSIGLGAAHTFDRMVNKTRNRGFEGAFIANWRPTDRLQLVPFLSVAHTPMDDNGPAFLPSGARLPPRLPRHVYAGPEWAQTVNTELMGGVVIDWTPAPGWEVKAGLFRSSAHFEADFSNLITGVQPDGRAAGQRIIADPPLFFVSNSGEVRLSRRIAEGPRAHVIHLALRGRAANRRFDGADVIELGPIRLGELQTAPLPLFQFGPQQADRVRQWTLGLAYEGRWAGVGEISLGLQRTDYRKRIGLPGAVPVATDASPLLVNAELALEVTPRLTVYAGYVTGIEESGIAPDNAANRNEAMPAIETRQIDAGFRWLLAGEMKLIGGVFEVRKPYFNIGQGGIFGDLGEVVNRGLEASVAGPLTPTLSVVAGTVLLQPRVVGEAVALGVSGPRPVNAITARIEASADWRPPQLSGLSLDAAWSHRSPETAVVSNAVSIPTRSLLNLGARYRFLLAGQRSLLRLQVTNVFDKQGYNLRFPGAYGQLPGRRFQGYLTVDF